MHIGRAHVVSRHAGDRSRRRHDRMGPAGGMMRIHEALTRMLVLVVSPERIDEPQITARGGRHRNRPFPQVRAVMRRDERDHVRRRESRRKMLVIAVAGQQPASGGIGEAARLLLR